MQRLEKKEKFDIDDDLQDNADVYAESFENESSALLLPSVRSSEASSSFGRGGDQSSVGILEPSEEGLSPCGTSEERLETLGTSWHRTSQ